MLLVKNKRGDEFVCTEEQFDEQTQKLGKKWKIVATDYVDKKKIIKQSVAIPKETTTKIEEHGKSTIKTDDKTPKPNRSRSKGVNKQ